MVAFANKICPCCNVSRVGALGFKQSNIVGWQCDVTAKLIDEGIAHCFSLSAIF